MSEAMREGGQLKTDAAARPIDAHSHASFWGGRASKAAWMWYRKNQSMPIAGSLAEVTMWRMAWNAGARWAEAR